MHLNKIGCNYVAQISILRIVTIMNKFYLYCLSIPGLFNNDLATVMVVYKKIRPNNE
jgi:hypothetical protein